MFIIFIFLVQYRFLLLYFSAGFLVLHVYMHYKNRGTLNKVQLDGIGLVIAGNKSADVIFVRFLHSDVMCVGMSHLDEIG